MNGNKGGEELEFRIDHFKLYRIKEAEAGASVALRGQFDRAPKKAYLSRLTHFANPVRKNEHEIRNKTAHLTWYELKEKEPDEPRHVTVKNQFGQQDWRIGKAVALAVPAIKREAESTFPWGLDHFKCYEVLKASAIEKRLVLEDQFGEDRVELGPARFFGVPVEKNAGGKTTLIKNERDHLVFYEISRRETHLEKWVGDQFGGRQVAIVESAFLGVPSLKIEATKRCIDFEDLLNGASYNVGSTFTTSGFNVTVQQFQRDNGTWTNGGYAEIQNGGKAGGSGNEAHANNVNLAIDFGGSITDLTFQFGEFGGNVNIEINGDFRNFENFADIHGATIGGVGVSVVNGLGNDQGVVTLSGSINSFAVGGQELWLDNFCPGSWNA